MTEGRLLWLADAVSDAGLPMEVEKGWEKRGRPIMDPYLFMVHHTGSQKYPGWIIRDGRSDLAGPLSQFGMKRDGTVVIVASGKSNHAGRKTNNVHPGIKGNARVIGLEAAGMGQDWPSVMVENMYRLSAVVCSHYGWPVDRVIAHHEWAGARGKWDPGLNGKPWPMNDFRKHVAALSGSEPVDQEVEQVTRTELLVAAHQRITVLYEVLDPPTQENFQNRPEAIKWWLGRCHVKLAGSSDPGKTLDTVMDALVAALELKRQKAGLT